MFWDPTYVLVLIGVVLCAIASINVKITYNKYNKIVNARGLTAEYVASMILQNAGIHDVKIERVRGSLTDHYSPKEKVLRLSDKVYGSMSVGAIGVAAHECGHAIQHHVEYFPLKLRSASVPLATIGSYMYWPVIIIGLVLGNMGIAQIGVLLFSLLVLFQLITLPVEFNASTRALSVLDEYGVLEGAELKGAKKVLKAAALT